MFPFVLINSAVHPDRFVTLVNHEQIHLRQQAEMLVIPFYVCYVLNYLFLLMVYKNHKKAYRNIIFEKEAFENEKKQNYLKERKLWQFLKYIKKAA